ncbi:RNA recognition motif 2 [Lasiodiplodia theobromae]|nr:RNA recognition motif 2 [Lasiodiplodia theobromae]
MHSPESGQQSLSSRSPIFVQMFCLTLLSSDKTSRATADSVYSLFSEGPDASTQNFEYDLQALLNTWVRGKFDFLYLHINFANMCNVGYAFVNFDMPMTIVEVKQKLDAHGWPWPGHLGSTKRAAMSYATVQGPG